METLQGTESYFQVGTLESLQKICCCWKDSAERKEQTDYFWSCSKRTILLCLVCLQERAIFEA